MIELDPTPATRPGDETPASDDPVARRLHELLMQAPVAISVMTGPALTYLLANPLYEELVGRRGLAGQPILAGFPEVPPDAPPIAMLQRVYDTGEPFSADEYPVRIARKSGGAVETLYLKYRVQPVFGAGGRVEAIMIVAIDVTGQVRARAEAERANRAKDEFLALLGHELRNPLAPILTAIQLIRLRGPDPYEREHTIIERQAMHLVRLVDDLLDVSRITRGAITLRRERVELASVVTAALEIADPLIEQRHHALSLDVPPQGLPVDADPARLAQVVANLLTNAARYTDPGGEITVTLSREGDEGVIRVRDTGIGITPEMLPRIFEMFAQSPQAIDRAQGGLGLGLAIVRSLVELHGGRAEARSEGVGRGAEFVLRLPLADESPAEAAPRPVNGSAHARRQRVLVVDDNKDLADSLAAALREVGCEVVVALDGPQALRAVAGFTPDVALIDLGLPVMDGGELARRLREDPRLFRARFIALSRLVDPRSAPDYRAAGFDAFVRKPVDLGVLRALVARPGAAA